MPFGLHRFDPRRVDLCAERHPFRVPASVPVSRSIWDSIRLPGTCRRYSAVYYAAILAAYRQPASEALIYAAPTRLLFLPSVDSFRGYFLLQRIRGWRDRADSGLRWQVFIAVKATSRTGRGGTTSVPAIILLLVGVGCGSGDCCRRLGKISYARAGLCIRTPGTCRWLWFPSPWDAQWLLARWRRRLLRPILCALVTSSVVAIGLTIRAPECVCGRPRSCGMPSGETDRYSMLTNNPLFRLPMSEIPYGSYPR